MQIASMHFKARAHEKLGDERLQRNLQKIKGKFVGKRRASLVELRGGAPARHFLGFGSRRRRGGAAVFLRRWIGLRRGGRIRAGGRRLLCLGFRGAF